jgi:predicted permease
MAGYFLKQRIRDTGQASKRIINANLALVEPVVALWSIWGLRLTGDLAALPLSGFITVSLGLVFGILFVRFMGGGTTKRATFLISSSLANHGFTMGAFICYLFMGERGLGLAFIYISYFMVFLYGVIFPYARKTGQGPEEKKSLRRYFISLQNMPLYAVVLALLLHALGIKRPAVPAPIELLIMVSVAAYYFSLGINFSFSDMRNIGRESAALACIKFVLVPGVVIAALTFVPLDGTLKKIIIIQSFMPAAIYSVISSLLFDLDSKLASGLFVSNMLLFIFAVFPVMFFVLG